MCDVLCMLILILNAVVFLFSFSFFFNTCKTDHNVVYSLQSRVAERHFLDLRKRYKSALAIDLVNKVYLDNSVCTSHEDVQNRFHTYKPVFRIRSRLMQYTIMYLISYLLNIFCLIFISMEVRGV